jgi:hypothetical protein
MNNSSQPSPVMYDAKGTCDDDFDDRDQVLRKLTTAGSFDTKQLWYHLVKYFVRAMYDAFPVIQALTEPSVKHSIGAYVGGIFAQVLSLLAFRRSNCLIKTYQTVKAVKMDHFAEFNLRCGRMALMACALKMPRAS